MREKNKGKVESWNLIYYNYSCGKKCCHSKISLNIQKDTITLSESEL